MTESAISLIRPAELPGIRSALLRYRIMAWVVGILLVVLVVVGMPMKYMGGNGSVVTAVGVPHGFLYMVLLVAAYDLSRRVGWKVTVVLGIMLAGTIPFLSFIAEHFATRDVRRRIADVESRGQAAADFFHDRHIDGALQAEEACAEYLRQAGFTNVAVINGRDHVNVAGDDIIGKVTMQTWPVNKSQVEQIQNARSEGLGETTVVFSSSGFSKRAIEEARTHDTQLVLYDRDGTFDSTTGQLPSIVLA